MRDCSREDWIAASAFHVQNENAFQVILLEVGLCYHAICEQAKGCECKFQNLEDLRESSTFEPASMKDIDEDREDTKKKIEDFVNGRNSSLLLFWCHFVVKRISPKLRLAQYVLLKLNCRPQQPHPDGSRELLNTIIRTEKCFSFWTWGGEVFLEGGTGAAGGVCKTSWLGIPCAKKSKIPGPYFSKEAGILSHVNHPNIVKFICCGK